MLFVACSIIPYIVFRVKRFILHFVCKNFHKHNMLCKNAKNKYLFTSRKTVLRQQKAAANASMLEKLHARRTSIFKRRVFNAIKNFFLRLKYSSYATVLYYSSISAPTEEELSAFSRLSQAIILYYSSFGSLLPRRRWRRHRPPSKPGNRCSTLFFAPFRPLTRTPSPLGTAKFDFTQ